MTGSFTSEAQADGTDLIGWTCPRCYHHHRQTIARYGWSSGLAAGPGGREGRLPLVCDCRQSHEPRPEGEGGCGYRTFLVVEEGDE